MMRAQKEMAVRVEKARTMSPEELAGKITIGVLVDRAADLYRGIPAHPGRGPGGVARETLNFEL